MNRQPNQLKDVQPIRNKQQIEDMKFALKRFCGERDYILFILGINTGLRIGDLLKLTIKEVKQKKKLVIQEGKTKKKREIYINGIYEELNAYINTIDSEWLFPSRKGDKPISSVQAYRQLNKASEMVDITEGIGTHTLRKTFGYWHYKQFGDVAKLQKILNHSHPSITLTYIGITEEEIENDMMQFTL